MPALTTLPAWTPEQLRKARRYGELSKAHAPNNRPPDVAWEMETIQAYLISSLGEDEIERIHDYVSLPEATAEFFRENGGYTPETRQAFLESCYAETLPQDVLNRFVDRYLKQRQLRSDIGQDLADFYMLMLDHGQQTASALEVLAKQAGFKTTSLQTVYRRLEALREAGLVEAIPKTYKVIET